MYLIDANRKASPYARDATVIIPFNYPMSSKGPDIQSLNLNSHTFKPKVALSIHTIRYPLSAINHSNSQVYSKMVALNSTVETQESALFTGTHPSHHSLATTTILTR
jgi:hypothetical protein